MWSLVIIAVGLFVVYALLMFCFYENTKIRFQDQLNNLENELDKDDLVNDAKVDQVTQFATPETARYDLPISKSSTLDIWEVEEFKNWVKDRRLGYYDGAARPVRDGVIGTNIWISPNELWKIPLDATHVNWCSK